MYESHEDRKNLFSNLIEACKEGKLKYDGSIDEQHWPIQFDVLERLGADKFVEAFENDYYDVIGPPEVLIHQDNLKSYFQSIGFWPVTDCLLVDWWHDKPQLEVVEDDKGKFEHAETTKWKAKAREIGAIWMNEQRQQGKDPGVIEVAKYVEGELKTLDI